jgi:hypothetical protein
LRLEGTIHHKINGSHGLIVIQGSPSLSLFKDATLRFVADPEFEPDLPKICDFTDASLGHITSVQFMSYVAFTRIHVPTLNHPRMALVASHHQTSSLMWMFRRSQNPECTRIFSTIGDATHWIENEAHTLPTDQDKEHSPTL